MEVNHQADISIVIPVYNEENEIRAREQVFLELRNKVKEVIFVDGGSDDDSVKLLTDMGMPVVQAPLGRASQMNAGASVAKASTLLFLHVDTQLPNLHDEQYQALVNSQWGFFLVQLNNPKWPFLVLSAGINFRSKFTRVGTGDQALFVHRDLFQKQGGFPEIALMEDIALSRNLRKHCLPLIIESPVTTSARRWEKGGVVRVMLLMWSLQLLFAIGVSPSRLAAWYGYKGP